LDTQPFEQLCKWQYLYVDTTQFVHRMITEKRIYISRQFGKYIGSIKTWQSFKMISNSISQFSGVLLRTEKWRMTQLRQFLS
jgi:hypothetical protein